MKLKEVFMFLVILVGLNILLAVLGFFYLLDTYSTAYHCGVYYPGVNEHKATAKEKLKYLLLGEIVLIFSLFVELVFINNITF